MDDSPLPNSPVRDVVLTERDKLLSELRGALAMALPRCVVSRYATAWAQSLEGAMSGRQSWALLCRYRSRLLLAEIPKGVDRKAEIKQRLHLWESGQISVWLARSWVSRILGRFAEQHERRSHRRSELVS